MGLHAADAFKQHILAVGQVWVHCSIPVPFPSLYWIGVLWGMTVAF